MTHAEIITIGDELLIGQVIDTNSAWIARQLNKLGLDVEYKTTVGDDEKDILDAFRLAFSRVSVVLVTGGIGPTKDDITKRTLCKFFDTRLIFDETTFQTVKEVVGGNKKAINYLTYAQAYVPEGATIIQNKAGTAPVTWFEKEDKVLVSMPGVPFEMKWVVENEIIPRLQKRFPVTDSIQHLTFWVKNYSESMLALYLTGFEEDLPEVIRLAYLPTSGMIRLRLTGKSPDADELYRVMSEQRTNLLSLLSEDIFSEEDEALEQILHNKLQEKQLTLALAESCTGGKLASMFTAIPGSSGYFKGSAVTYSNEAKTEVLGVANNDVELYGAVSQPIVEQMVRGARRIFRSDCAIATSGIAGPGGETSDKPVGTVWIAVAYQDQIKTELFHFTNNRENNIQRASYTGIRMLLEMIN